MPGFRSLFQQIQRRPGGYFGHEPSSSEVFAFLLGCDLATDGTLLSGFREWLLVKTDGPANLVLQGVARHAFRADEVQGDFTPEDDREFVAALWTWLDDFMDERSQHDGDARIFEAYIRWRDGKPYNDMWPVGSLNEREGSVDSPPAAHASEDAHEVHRIRRTPLSALGAAEYTKLVSLWLNIELVVPHSIALIHAARPDLDDPELALLVQALVELGPSWWADHPNYLADFRRAIGSVHIADTAVARGALELLQSASDANGPDASD